jgi:hypothetical protein
VPQVLQQLEIARCPHCQIDRPNLTRVHAFDTTNNARSLRRWWGIYFCSRCGGVVAAASANNEGEAIEIFPSPTKVDDELPTKAKGYLEQAVASMHAPAGAVMLAASAVDAMLKAKSLTSGSLYSRIDEAAESHLITAEMAAWAHEIRLDANDQRHADVNADLPTAEDARRCLDFAIALGQFLFVLPARVARGRAAASTC